MATAAEIKKAYEEWREHCKTGKLPDTGHNVGRKGIRCRP